MANAAIQYRAAATVTIGLASLASSSNGDVGREATAISNSTNKDLDALLSGKITVGTTPVIDTNIQIWVFAARNDTPTWLGGMAGSDADATWTSVGVRDGAAVLIHTLQVDSITSDRAYEFSGLSIASAFDVMPDDWSVFITHDTGVVLNATAGNHVMEYIGITYA